MVSYERRGHVRAILSANMDITFPVNFLLASAPIVSVGKGQLQTVTIDPSILRTVYIIYFDQKKYAA